MASRSHGWFDAAQLLPGEELVRMCNARVRTDTPPYWWEGRLILTSDRLFFLPFVENPFLSTVAFWLRDVLEAGPAGRNAFHVRTTAEAALFRVKEQGVAAFLGRSGRSWASSVLEHIRGARPASAFTSDTPFRRAAG